MASDDVLLTSMLPASVLVEAVDPSGVTVCLPSDTARVGVAFLSRKIEWLCQTRPAAPAQAAPEAAGMTVKPWSTDAVVLAECDISLV